MAVTLQPTQVAGLAVVSIMFGMAISIAVIVADSALTFGWVVGHNLPWLFMLFGVSVLLIIGPSVIDY